MPAAMVLLVLLPLVRSLVIGCAIAPLLYPLRPGRQRPISPIGAIAVLLHGLHLHRGIVVAAVVHVVEGHVVAAGDDGLDQLCCHCRQRG